MFQPFNNTRHICCFVLCECGGRRETFCCRHEPHARFLLKTCWGHTWTCTESWLANTGIYRFSEDVMKIMMMMMMMMTMMTMMMLMMMMMMMMMMQKEEPSDKAL